MSSVIRCWSDLPADILGQIIRRFQDYADFLRFGAVCHPWHWAQMNSGCPFLYIPALAFPQGDGSPDFLYIYSPFDQRTHKIPFPHMGYQVDLCVGASSDGVLITLDDDLEIRASNPFTGERIPLPPTGALEYGVNNNIYSWRKARRARDQGHESEQAKKSLLWHFARKAIIDSSSNRLVTLRGGAVFALTSSADALSDGRGRSPPWRAAHTTCHSTTDDMIFHKGIVHAVDRAGGLLTLDPDGPEIRHLIHEASLQIGSVEGSRYSLVESYDGEDLYMIHTKEPSVTIRVFVLEDEEGRRRWREVADIGESVFFLSSQRSVSVSTREYPQLKKNYIYK